ncbi:MAG: PEP-CTERM sorting domain-containing protein [Kiritimatiellae bacterium]|nr:PEP-CTERM sorting domain-containing protein [Kiritimatiellia bacterium]
MKRYLIMASLAMAAVVTHGYSLRWNVDVGDATDVDSAILVAVSNGDPATYYLSGGYSNLGENIKTDLENDMEQYDPNLNSTQVTGAAYSGNKPLGNVDWSNYSFHVLLVDSSGNHLLSTEGMDGNSMSFTDLRSFGYTGFKVWAVTPEPSCALLFGLGAALVAVRRRRR